MPDMIAAHLARRGLQMARQAVPNQPPMDEASKKLLEAYQRFWSPGVLILFGLTLLLALFVSCGLEYNLRYLCANLTAVEHVYDESSLEFELDGLLDEEEEGGASHKKEYDDVQIPVDEAGKGEAVSNLLNPGKKMENGGISSQNGPITKSVRATNRHLWSIGGFRGLFRGFKAFAVMFIVMIGVSFVTDLVIPTIPWTLASEMVAMVIAWTAVAPLHCSWTHATIRAKQATKPNGVHNTPAHVTGWRRYLPGVWSRHLFLPTIRMAFSIGVLVEGFISILVAVTTQLPRDLPWFVSLILAFLAPTIFAVVFGMGVAIPAVITLTRIEASLLPESDSAIVPFDRKFGGRYINFGAKETSWWRNVWLNLGPVGTWKSFDKDTFWRVAAVYGWFYTAGFICVVLSVGLICAEVYAVLGDQTQAVLGVFAAQISPPPGF